MMATPPIMRRQNASGTNLAPGDDRGKVAENLHGSELFKKAAKGPKQLLAMSLLLVLLAVFAEMDTSGIASRQEHIGDEAKLPVGVSLGNNVMMNQTTSLSSSPDTQSQSTPHSQSSTNAKAVIAYAVTITGCPPDASRFHFLDAAGVLARSIHLQSIRHPGSQSSYDYRLFAFVHKDAMECAPTLKHFNYTILPKSIPVNISAIRSKDLRMRTESGRGCCGKGGEFIKLYSLTLTDFPVVVHLDVDCLILKPMDDLFDILLTKNGNSIKRIPHAQHKSDQIRTYPVETFFTRDYFLGRPRWPVKFFGVQAGFWIVKPNLQAFEEIKLLILNGTFHSGWQDHTEYFPNHYGSPRMSGTLNWYYSHLHPTQKVELNRCYFNQMADTPLDYSWCKKLPRGCQNCAATDLKEVYSAHFTSMCTKPWQCQKQLASPLCQGLHDAWHRVRVDLESSLSGLRKQHDADVVGASFYAGHCKADGTYSPLSTSIK